MKTVNASAFCNGSLDADSSRIAASHRILTTIDELTHEASEAQTAINLAQPDDSSDISIAEFRAYYCDLAEQITGREFN